MLEHLKTSQFQSLPNILTPLSAWSILSHPSQTATGNLCQGDSLFCLLEHLSLLCRIATGTCCTASLPTKTTMQCRLLHHMHICLSKCHLQFVLHQPQLVMRLLLCVWGEALGVDLAKAILLQRDAICTNLEEHCQCLLDCCPLSHCSISILELQWCAISSKSC